jgi:hypothetical protein
LELIYRNDQADTQLPLECGLRLKIVREMLETGRRATCLEDVIVRQRYAIEMGRDGCHGLADEAVLLDLEHLAERGLV